MALVVGANVGTAGTGWPRSRLLHDASFCRNDQFSQETRRANDKLLCLDDEEEDQTTRNDPRPDPKRNSFVAEHRLERWCIGEQQLQYHDRNYAQWQVLVAHVR